MDVTTKETQVERTAAIDAVKKSDESASDIKTANAVTEIDVDKNKISCRETSINDKINLDLNDDGQFPMEAPSSHGRIDVAGSGDGDVNSIKPVNLYDDDSLKTSDIQKAEGSDKTAVKTEKMPAAGVDKSDNSTSSMENIIDEDSKDQSDQMLGSDKLDNVKVKYDGKMSLSQALQTCVYDSDMNMFVDPSTGMMLTLAEAIDNGLIDDSEKVINDLESCDVICIRDAIDRGLIDPVSGVMHSGDDTALPLGMALQNGLIMDDGQSDNQIAEFLDQFETDPTNKETEESFVLTDAIRNGLYDPETNSVTDPVNGTLLTLVEALDRGLVTSDSIFVH